MREFPATPVAPAELLEGHLPEALAALETPPGFETLEVELGVRLEGEGGGEWVVALEKGNVTVSAGTRAAAAFSYVQSVSDWQGALWEGRGSWLGKGAASLFRPGADEAQQAAGLLGSALPSALGALAEIRGLLRVVVAGPDGDWQVGLQFGPGEIPPEPSAAVHVSGEDVDQMIAGELPPVEAFMAGRIRVVGDMTLLLQLQAAAMQAAGSFGDAAER